VSVWAALTLRTRLAVAYVIATSLVLCAFAIFVAFFVHERLHAEIAHRLDQEVEIAERSLRMDGAGRLVWYAPHGAHEAYLPLRNVSWLDIHRPDGMLIYRVPESDMAGTAAAIPSFEKERTSGIFSITTPGSVQYRVLQRDIEIAGQRAISRAAISEDQAERQLDTLYWVIGLGLPLAMLLSGFGGYLMAGRALAPMSRITAQARAINAERLDARLPVVNRHDELGELTVTFNDLFFRLQRSFEELKRCTADASHELRTPLTIIRSVGEVGLGRHQDEAGYREVIGTMLEEADRLTLLIDSLLALTRVEGLQCPSDAKPVDLGALADDVAIQFGVLAEEKGQTLTVERTEPVSVTGDSGLLHQVIVNILDNAIKYTQAGGRVRLRVDHTDSEAILEIADNGPGIAAENQKKVFERFYRVDTSRSRTVEGFGLGLAIARRVVEIHGGRIEVSSACQTGSLFRVVLPLAVSPNQRDINRG
jgi:heavy metal sensor kinase